VVEEEIVLSPEGFSFSNPAASRYLYAPSSIGLQKGQGYASQKLIFATGVYGITDNVTLLVGTAIPIPFLTVIGGKFSTKIADNMHIGAGAEVFFLPFAEFTGDNTVPLSIFFGSFTYGNLDKHITIASGYIYEQLLSENQHAMPIMVAGHTRVSDRLALVTENWILLEASRDNDSAPIFLGSINSIAFRIIGRRNSKTQIYGRLIADNGYPRSTWDIGLVLATYSERQSIYDSITGTDIYSNYSTVQSFGPLPWIDYTWHFGPARR
jgi:hypothetical protein